MQSIESSRYSNLRTELNSDDAPARAAEHLLDCIMDRRTHSQPVERKKDCIPEAVRALHAAAGSNSEEIQSTAKFKLTTRQLEVLCVMASDLTTNEICKGLRITEDTLRTHQKALRRIFGVRTSRAAVDRAKTAKLI